MEGKNNINKTSDIDNAAIDDLRKKMRPDMAPQEFVAAHEYCNNILKTDPQNYKAWEAKAYIAFIAFHNATSNLNSIENYVYGKSAWDTDGEYPSIQKILYYADKALHCANDDEKNDLLELLYSQLRATANSAIIAGMGSSQFIEYHITTLDYINANFDPVKQFPYFEKYIKCLFNLAGGIYDFEADVMISLLLEISSRMDKKLISNFADDILLHVNKLKIALLKDKAETLSDIQAKIKDGFLSYIDEYNEKKTELQKLRELTETTANIPEDLANTIDELMRFNTDDMLVKKYVDKVQEAYDAMRNCTDKSQLKNLFIRFKNAQTELKEKYQPTLSLSESLKAQAEMLLNTYNNGASQWAVNNYVAFIFALLIFGLIVFLVVQCS